MDPNLCMLDFAKLNVVMNDVFSDFTMIHNMEQ